LLHENIGQKVCDTAADTCASAGTKQAQARRRCSQHFQPLPLTQAPGEARTQGSIGQEVSPCYAPLTAACAHAHAHAQTHTRTEVSSSVHVYTHTYFYKKRAHLAADVINDLGLRAVVATAYADALLAAAAPQPAHQKLEGAPLLDVHRGQVGAQPSAPRNYKQ